MRKSLTQPHDGPKDIIVPDDVLVVPPAPHLPGSITDFFGTTGKWWGTWKSPQVKGGFDAVLIVERLGEAQAEVVYVVPDYPAWYIKSCVWRTAARIERRDAENDRLSLIMPYEPLHTTMECWFEGNDFKGIMYGRFMKQVTLWKPLK